MRAERPAFSTPLRFVIDVLRSTERTDPPLVMSDSDWHSLAALARRNGVSSFIRSAIGTRAGIPNAVSCELTVDVQENALRSLQGTSELIQIVGALNESQVPAIALKGPAQSVWLYGDASVRRFADLDILVTPDDRGRAMSVLGRLGYRLPGDMPAGTAGVIYAALGAWPLTSPQTFPVDLHWRLAHAEFPAPLTPSEILAECDVVELGGVRVRIPSPTHCALLLLVHAAKHLWCTLEGLLGIERLMRRDDVDWKRVRARAGAARVWSGCAAGLRLASDIFGTELPADLHDEPLTVNERLEQCARTALELPAGVFHDRWVERQAHRATLDRWDDRIRYDFWRVIGPTPLEWRWCRLPEPLSTLYVPLRLVRLAVAGLRGSLRSSQREASTGWMRHDMNRDGAGADESPSRNESHVQASH
jgi:Uncharacterised nucleotidyltransferase